MKRNKFLISTVLEKQDIPSDYCSKLGSEHWRLDRITWDLCAEDCSKSFKTKNHVTILIYIKNNIMMLCNTIEVPKYTTTTTTTTTML